MSAGVGGEILEVALCCGPFLAFWHHQAGSMLGLGFRVQGLGGPSHS